MVVRIDGVAVGSALGVVSLVSVMAEHGLHFDKMLGFAEHGVMDLFVDVGAHFDVYCIDAATTKLDIPTYLLAYSEFASVEARPAISVPHALPEKIRLLRVSKLCVKQMLKALRNGQNFSVSQQVFDCGIGVDGGGDYSLVKPDSNPGYKLAGFDDSVQWCFGAYPAGSSPELAWLSFYYSAPSYISITTQELCITSDGVAKLVSALSLAAESVVQTNVVVSLSSSSEEAIVAAVTEVPTLQTSYGESDRLLSMKDLIEIMSFSRSKINNLRSSQNKGYDPTFPRPIDTGSTAVRWRESEIRGWIASRKLKA
ncbi:putative transcriptional regulator [Pseudomonas sp. GM21]|uniref:helix-turn-helix transcriptional regulator n=1 Tax=Pseudomonas sp. GM21 TaxID=1144325 RepID=UPI0002725400|nr:AlpA family phage regulatory protein [Pseudomonas sp. GM21]EJM13804.1 putative transcriptional regulator [Pseudomonas sp. GM21]